MSNFETAVSNTRKGDACTVNNYPDAPQGGGEAAGTDEFCYTPSVPMAKIETPGGKNPS